MCVVGGGAGLGQTSFKLPYLFAPLYNFTSSVVTDWQLPDSKQNSMKRVYLRCYSW